MSKNYFFLTLIMFFSTTGTEIKNYINQKDIETSRRIFIVKPEKIYENINSFQVSKKENEIIGVIQENFELTYTDSSEIIPKLKEISTAKITGLGKIIALKGSKEEINELICIIEKFDRPKRQIEIKATIIDTSDNLFERLGIDLSAGKNSDNEKGDIKSTFLEGNFSLAAILKKGGNFLGINIDFLKENGDIKIEAMPALLILEGNEGELKITEEVIVGEKKYTDKDNEYIEPVFAEAGVVFKIKPEINELDNSKEIVFYVDSEISNFKLSSNFNINQGAKQKNKISTVVSVKDGTSVFIGGLKQNVQKDSEKRIPLLSKIPFLGNLFKYKRKNKEIRDIYIEIEGKIQPNTK